MGNSLPIREWSQVSTWEKCFSNVYGNRGVNGIDGLVSASAGVASRGENTWLILGDLSTIYDLSGLWWAKEFSNLKVIVINNYGGKIFSKIFEDPIYQTRHSLQFESWAKMFGAKYSKWKSYEDLDMETESQVIEIQIGESQ